MHNHYYIECSKKLKKKREGSRSTCGLGFFLLLPSGPFNTWSERTKEYFEKDLKEKGFTYKVKNKKLVYFCKKHGESKWVRQVD